MCPAFTTCLGRGTTSKMSTMSLMTIRVALIDMDGTLWDGPID